MIRFDGTTVPVVVAEGHIGGLFLVIPAGFTDDAAETLRAATVRAGQFRRVRVEQVPLARVVQPFRDLVARA